MFKRAFWVFTILPVLLLFNACGQRNKTEEKTGSATESDSSVVKPGEMVLIPAGEFTFGTNDKESLAFPEQKINLPAFWIDKYEVTNSQFLDFSIKNNYTGEGAKEGRDWRLFFTPDKALFPVVYITWNDADAYCKSQGKRFPLNRNGKRPPGVLTEDRIPGEMIGRKTAQTSSNRARRSRLQSDSSAATSALTVSMTCWATYKNGHRHGM